MLVFWNWEKILVRINPSRSKRSEIQNFVLCYDPKVSVTYELDWDLLMCFCVVFSAVSLFCLALFCLFCSRFSPLLSVSKYVLRRPPLCIFSRILVTSEEGWSGQPKYCFEYILPRRCISLTVVFDLSSLHLLSLLQSNSYFEWP